MRYLIVFLTFIIFSSCYVPYQSTNNLQSQEPDYKNLKEETCELREWSLSCLERSYSFDGLVSCSNVFNKKYADISIRYDVPLISPTETPQHASNEHLLISERSDRCIERANYFSDVKRCVIRLQKDMMRISDC